MLLFLLFAVALFHCLGLSVMPVLFGGALAMVAMGYRLSRCRMLLRYGGALLIIGAARYLSANLLERMPALAGGVFGKLPHMLQSDTFLAVVCIIVMLIALLVGVYGPPVPDMPGDPIGRLLERRRGRNNS